jgi:hypothetical protein
MCVKIRKRLRFEILTEKARVFEKRQKLSVMPGFRVTDGRVLGLGINLLKCDKRMIGMFQEMIRHARNRDKSRGFYDEEHHVTIDSLCALIIAQNAKCLWCRCIFEYAAGPKQMSLDRVNNSKAHTTVNCVMACLSCNHKRCKTHS